MEHKILFRTISGSRLYGLEHEGSDWDYYTVVDTVRTKKATYSTHKIVDGIDSVVVDMGTFIGLCQKGVPQALEAMFSTKADIDHIPEFRAAFRAGTEIKAYLGAMKQCASEDTLKSRRHTIRLGVNLSQIGRNKRFNPTLNPGQVRGITQAAERWDAEKCYQVAKEIAFWPR